MVELCSLHDRTAFLALTTSISSIRMNAVQIQIFGALSAACSLCWHCCYSLKIFTISLRFQSICSYQFLLDWLINVRFVLDVLYAADATAAMMNWIRDSNNKWFQFNSENTTESREFYCAMILYRDSNDLWPMWPIDINFDMHSFLPGCANNDLVSYFCMAKFNRSNTENGRIFLLFFELCSAIACSSFWCRLIDSVSNRPILINLQFQHLVLLLPNTGCMQNDHMYS